MHFLYFFFIQTGIQYRVFCFISECLRQLFKLIQLFWKPILFYDCFNRVEKVFTAINQQSFLKNFDRNHMFKIIKASLVSYER